MTPDVKRRRDRILANLGELDAETSELIARLIDEVAWQESKLEQTREAIGKAPSFIPYDNGGGQKGWRRNPAYDSYHALFKSYTAGLRALREITGRVAEADAERPGRLAEMRRGSPLFKTG